MLFRLSNGCWQFDPALKAPTPQTILGHRREGTWEDHSGPGIETLREPRQAVWDLMGQATGRGRGSGSQRAQGDRQRLRERHLEREPKTGAPRGARSETRGQCGGPGGTPRAGTWRRDTPFRLWPPRVRAGTRQRRLHPKVVAPSCSSLWKARWQSAGKSF